MDLLSSTSIIAAFIAGVAALFAPCCITVLLPSYLGSIFKERYKVVFMTFVFFLGIFTVFLPIGLGASALASFFNNYHNQIFIGGGLMLAVLGALLISGKKMSMPFMPHPALKNASVWSVYVLGIFSAIATTCCAPVLAGVLALSATSGSVFWGGVYTLAYVFGMVAPLFFIALFLDKTNFTKKLMGIRKPRQIELAGKSFRFILSELIAGIVFLGMGIYIVYLALTNQLLMESSYQLTINLFTAKLVHGIHNYLGFIPNAVWGLVVIILVILITNQAIKQFKKYE